MTEQTEEVPQAPKRNTKGQYAKGYSGNPHGPRPPKPEPPADLSSAEAKRELPQLVQRMIQTALRGGDKWLRELQKRYPQKFVSMLSILAKWEDRQEQQTPPPPVDIGVMSLDDAAAVARDMVAQAENQAELDKKELEQLRLKAARLEGVIATNAELAKKAKVEPAKAAEPIPPVWKRVLKTLFADQGDLSEYMKWIRAERPRELLRRKDQAERAKRELEIAAADDDDGLAEGWGPQEGKSRDRLRRIMGA